MTRRWTLVFLADTKFFDQVKHTIHTARTIGQWKQDIVLMTDVGEEKMRELSHNNVIHYPLSYLDVSAVREFWKHHPSHTHHSYMMEKHHIQFQKLHLFDPFFKQWDVLFFMDANINIYRSLEGFLNHDPQGYLLAHSDAYPNYKRKLECQFSFELVSKEVKDKMMENFFLDCDYFQTTVMIIDTCLIEPGIKEIVLGLAKQFPFCCRCEQSIMNLLFNCHYKKWRQLPISDHTGFYYDFSPRYVDKSKYIMTKIQHHVF